MYKVKQLIDEGLNLDILSNETKSGIDLLKTISQDFTVDDEVGLNLDEELYKDININYKQAFSEKTVERLAGAAVAKISGEDTSGSSAESGNPFIGDEYFKKNPEKVLGEQSLGGRFGSTIVVSGNNDALDLIDAPVLPKVFNKFSQDISSSNVPKEDILEKVFDNSAKEKASGPPARKPRQISGQKREIISQEQTESPEAYTFREIVDKYNPEISREEMEAFLYCDPVIPYKKYIDEFKYQKEDLVKQGFICYHDGKLIYKWIYLSGDINEKMTYLKRDEEIIRNTYGAETFENQKNALLESIPRQMDIGRTGSEDDNINIIPHSEFSKKFALKGNEAVFIMKHVNHMSENEFTLFTLFLSYLSHLRQRERSAFLNADPAHVEKFILRKPIQVADAPKGADAAEKKLAKKRNDEAKQKAKDIAQMLFQKMLYEELTSECKMRFKIVWNEKFNSINLPNYNKIPVGFSLSKYIGNQKLTLNSTQRETVAFINYIKSGCSALEVGLGKTIGALACISQAVENNYAKNPLLVVPKNVYYQWIKETTGKQSEQTLAKYVGALHHYPAVRELYNMNESAVYDIKDYTDPELAAIKQAFANRRLVQEHNKAIGKQNTIPASLFSSENPLEKFANAADRYSDTYVQDKIDIIKDKYSFQIEQLTQRGETEKVQKLTAQLREKISAIRDSKLKTFMRVYNKFVKEEYTYLIYATGSFPKMAPGTITIITEDALKMNKLGTMSTDSIAERMYKILSQGDVLDDSDKDYDERAGTKLMERIKERIESRLGNSKVNIEDLGCDMLILDEAHHYRKIFTTLSAKVKKDESGNIETSTSKGKDGKTTKKPEREEKNYDLSSGNPSGVALSAFFLSQYIQMTNPTGNVILLTATPFENNPLEIYSMLSLANYAELEKAGFEGMQDFFDTFMKVDFGYKIKINGVEKDTILNGYVNLVQLRTIIRNVILHRTGEQANILRPEKVIIPYTNSGLLPENVTEIKTNLVPTDEQMEIIRNIDLFIEGVISLTDLQSRDMEKFLIEETLKEQEEIERQQREEEETPGAETGEDVPEVLVEVDDIVPENKIVDVTLQIESEEVATRIIQAITLKRQVTLSPYLLKTRRSANVDPSPEELVESSPKLKYIMTCIKTVKEHHEKNGTPVSGQIIYSVIGKHMFPKIREYLIKNIGFKPEEVGIVAGGMGDSAKEAIKTGFYEGSVKVLIASKSIQVGANLNKNATVLYHLFYDWNPTDNEQINGRIWRQGNQYSAVRIVYPMVENSVDPFIFQYLENKTNRIKDIWDIAGVKSQMDLSDFDPRKMKTEAMTDPVKRAKLEIDIVKDETLSEIMLTENKLREIGDIPAAIHNFRESTAMAASYITSFHWGIAAVRTDALTKERTDKLYDLSTEIEKVREPITKIEEERNEKIRAKEFQSSELQTRIDNMNSELQAEQAELKSKIADAATGDDDNLLKSLQSQYKSLPAKIETEKSNLTKEIGRIGKDIEKLKAEADKAIKALGDIPEKVAKLEKKMSDLEASYAKKLEAVKEQGQMKDDMANKSQEGRKEYYTFLMREATYILNYMRDPESEGKRTDHMRDFFYNSSNIAIKLETFKNQKAEYERIQLKYLIPMGITDENAEQIVVTYRSKLEELRNKLNDIDSLKDELIARFTKEYYERLANAKSPEQSAMDFALLNWLLDEKVEQVSAIPATVVEDVEPEPMDKEYIETKVEMFMMALDIEEDSEMKEYLVTKIEMFQMALVMEAEPKPQPKKEKAVVKGTIKVRPIAEPVMAFKEGGNIPGHNLDSYMDLVHEGLMTKNEFVTFMRIKGHKVMPKSVYNEIKNVDSYDFMTKILKYNNLI